MTGDARRIAMLGAGGWGTALAVHLGRQGHEVMLWGRDASLVADLQTRRANAVYLPDVMLPERVRVTADLAEALGDVEFIVAAIPSHGTRAVLRRVQGNIQNTGVIRSGDLEIDLVGFRVMRGEDTLSLTRTEFNLLAILAGHPGQAFSREQLLNRLYDVAYEGFERSIDAHIKNLRQKLEPDPASPRYVLTVYGIGYRFSDDL